MGSTEMERRPGRALVSLNFCLSFFPCDDGACWNAGGTTIEEESGLN